MDQDVISLKNSYLESNDSASTRTERQATVLITKFLLLSQFVDFASFSTAL